MAAEGAVAIELEHAIGYSGAVYDGLHLLKEGRQCVYAAGSCIGES
jgi:hypothetical protein